MRWVGLPPCTYSLNVLCGSFLEVPRFSRINFLSSNQNAQEIDKLKSSSLTSALADGELDAFLKHLPCLSVRIISSSFRVTTSPIGEETGWSTDQEIMEDNLELDNGFSCSHADLKMDCFGAWSMHRQNKKRENLYTVCKCEFGARNKDRYSCRGHPSDVYRAQVALKLHDGAATLRRMTN